jgi:Protein of unknown function (DUF1579)
MKEYAMVRVIQLAVVVAIFSSVVCQAQESPDMPKPQKEHAWLQQLAGDWDSETTVKPPGQPEVKMKGRERSGMIGGFWLVAENTSDMTGTPYTGILTLGYDSRKKQYVGTWIDSMGDYLWHYTGKVTGKKITLEAKGPSPLKPGKLSNFKETVELTDADHKVFTSTMQEDNGSWTPMLTIKYTRKKK